MKKTFYSELAYVFGVIILAFGTAIMEKADFGMSMVVAPAYIIHLKLSQVLPFFSFGMAEYCLQLVLLVIMCLALRRFKRGYIFSFVTAVFYGFALDLCMLAVSPLPAESFAVRILFFIPGMVICSLGVALLFKTYFAPEVYELAVKEISNIYNKKLSRVKTVYDLVSLAVSVVLSFAFFGFLVFRGVKLGTLITALVNGWLIGRISLLLDKKFSFKDKFKLRNTFEN